MKKILCVLISLCMLISLSMTVFALSGTSFEYRYPEKYKESKAVFSDFRNLVSDEFSNTPIPGIENTVFPDGKECKTMVPQGLCFAGKYMLVTAYDYDKKFNSVVYIISFENEKFPEYKGMLIMPDKNHSGGICFDGKYIYIARSTTKTVGAIDIEKAERADSDGFVYIESFDRIFKCDTTASFITYFDNKIWVGLYDEDKSGLITGYTTEGDRFIKQEIFTIPSKCQGGAFTEYGGKTYFVASTSYGRTLPSKIITFEADFKKQELKEINKFTFPPMSEETEIYNGRLYVMFESSAGEYSTNVYRCINPIDRVCAIEDEKLFAEEQSFFEKVISFFERIVDRIIASFRKVC